MSPRTHSPWRHKGHTRRPGRTEENSAGVTKRGVSKGLRSATQGDASRLDFAPASPCPRVPRVGDLLPREDQPHELPNHSHPAHPARRAWHLRLRRQPRLRHRQAAERPPPPTRSRVRSSFDAKADDIEKLVVTPAAGAPAGSKPLELAKTDGKWNLVQPVAWPAEAFDARGLVDSFAEPAQPRQGRAELREQGLHRPGQPPLPGRPDRQGRQDDQADRRQPHRPGQRPLRLHRQRPVRAKWSVAAPSPTSSTTG